MRKKTISFLLVGLVLGAFCSYARWAQILTCFDADTGFYSSGFHGKLVVILIVIGALVLSALIAGMPASHFAGNPYGRKSACHLILACIAAVVTIIGGVRLLGEAGSHYRLAALLRVVALLGILAGVSYPLLAREMRQKAASGFAALLSLVPVIFCCIWIVTLYREHSADPVVWDFGIEVLAIAAATLAHFFAAGFAFAGTRPRAMLFCSAMAVLFTLPFLAGRLSGSYQLLYLGSTVELVALCLRTSGKPAAE